jgi:hypothetical protein
MRKRYGLTSVIRPDFGDVLSPGTVSIRLYIDVLHRVLCVVVVPQLMKCKVDQFVLRGFDETLELSDRLWPSFDLLRHAEHL